MSRELIRNYQEHIGCTIGILAAEIYRTVRTVSPRLKILSRVKDPKILTWKMILKDVRSVFDIDDVYGFRILTSSVVEAYSVLKILVEAFPGHLDHDYIAKPKTRPDKPYLNGKCLRLLQVILYRSEIPFEVQITTFDFNEANELLHNDYHNEKYGRVEGDR